MNKTEHFDADDILMDIDDFELEAATYEVWFVGYGVDGAFKEVKLGTFTDPDEAVAFAKNTSAQDINNILGQHSLWGGKIQVDTVIDVDDNQDNVGTVYSDMIVLN